MPMPWQNVTLPDLSGVQVDKPKFLRPGLLDQIFGMGGQDTGLFGQDVTKRAGQMGLLNAGLTMLAAGGRQPNRSMYGPRPNLGQALLQSLQAGQQGYQQVLGGASDLGNMKAKQEEAAMAAAKQAQIERLQQEFMAGPQTPERMTEYTAKIAAVTGNAGAMSQAAIAAAGLKPEPEKPMPWKEVDRGDVIELRHPVTGEIIDTVKKAQRPMGGGGGGARGPTPYQQFGMENSIGDDFNREIKTWDETGTLIQSALGSADMAMRGSGPATNQIVVAFVKALDPTSVAREGEVDLARRSGAVMDRARSLIDQVMQGKSPIVPEDVKREMISLLRERQSKLARRVVDKRNSFAGLSQEYGLRDDRLRLPSWAAETGVEFEDVSAGSSSGKPSSDMARRQGETIAQWKARTGQR